VLLKWVDLQTLYLIDAITCIAPIWATFRLSPIPPTVMEAVRNKWGFTAVLDGFRYLAGNHVVLMSFVVDLIAMILGMPRALFPQMAHESFGGPVEGGTAMALLAAGIAVGAVAGGVFSGWLPRIRRQGLAVVVAIVVWGLAMVGFGLASGQAHGTASLMLWIALAFLAIGGAADMVSSVFRNTILQQAASDEVRGRLQGVFTVVVAGGPRLADAVHGGAAAVVGTTVAAAGGGALVVVGVVACALLVPIFTRYRVADNDKV
jgi:Major Facilitator Superfamily